MLSNHSFASRENCSHACDLVLSLIYQFQLILCYQGSPHVGEFAACDTVTLSV